MIENNNNEIKEDENLSEIPENSGEISSSGINSETDEDDASKFQEFFTEKIETEKPKITDTLLTFIELKNVDEELAEIEDEKGDLPGAIAGIKQKIDVLNSELTEKNESVKNLASEKTSLEKSNEDFENKINKYDEEKYNVRSNKEYDEIVKSIEQLFDEIKKNETRLKEINELLTTLQSEVEARTNSMKELETELSEKQKLLDELNEQYYQDESVLKEKRNELMAKLDANSSTMYERINNSYKGEATAIVRRGNCSGCYNSIPPQRVIEIKSAEKIFTCQSCGRILIAEELVNQ